MNTLYKFLSYVLDEHSTTTTTKTTFYEMIGSWVNRDLISVFTFITVNNGVREKSWNPL